MKPKPQGQRGVAVASALCMRICTHAVHSTRAAEYGSMWHTVHMHAGWAAGKGILTGMNQYATSHTGQCATSHTDTDDRCRRGVAVMGYRQSTSAPSIGNGERCDSSTATILVNSLTHGRPYDC